jgi:hypothetical protein
LFTSTFAKILAAQVFEMQVDVILGLTDAAPLANLDGHGAADHVARRQVFRIRCIALHEALAGGVRQVSPLASRPFSNETTGAIDPGRVELHEFHVLQRQAGSKRHPAPVAGARVRRGAREPRSAVAAGGQNDLVRAEAMQRAVGHVEGDDAAALAVFHNQVEGEVFDEKTRLMLQRLLIQGMQHGVPGAIGRRAGSLRNSLAEMRGHPAEGPLIYLAVLGARERHSIVFEFDNGRRRFLAHEFDGVLISQPVRTLHGVIHMPAPIVVAHVAERRGYAALRSDGMAARREHFGQTGSRQPSFRQTERGAQTRAARADHDHIVCMINEFVFAHESFKIRTRRAGWQICSRRQRAHTGIATASATRLSIPQRAHSPR